MPRTALQGLALDSRHPSRFSYLAVCYHMYNTASHKARLFLNMTQSQLDDALANIARIAFDRYELRTRIPGSQIMSSGLE